MCAAVGGLLGGYVGDFAAQRWPHHGRIWACQFSVAIGIPFSLLILKVLLSSQLNLVPTSKCAREEKDCFLLQGVVF